jgi:hypothetical protein
MLKYKILKQASPSILGGAVVGSEVCLHEVKAEDKRFIDAYVSQGFVSIIPDSDCNCGSGGSLQNDDMEAILDAQKQVTEAVAKAAPLLANAPEGSIQKQLSNEIQEADTAIKKAVKKIKE